MTLLASLLGGFLAARIMFGGFYLIAGGVALAWSAVCLGAFSRLHAVLPWFAPMMPSNLLGAIYWTMLAHLDATPGEVRFCQCGCGEEIRSRSKKKIYASVNCRVNGNRWKKEVRLPELGDG